MLSCRTVSQCSGKHWFTYIMNLEYRRLERLAPLQPLLRYIVVQVHAMYFPNLDSFFHTKCLCNFHLI